MKRENLIILTSYDFFFTKNERNFDEFKRIEENKLLNKLQNIVLCNYLLEVNIVLIYFYIINYLI